MNGALDLARRGGAAGLAVEVRDAAQLRDVASGILHHFLALDDVGVLQAHLAVGLQAKVFRRRNFREVLGVDEDFARERDLPFARSFILRIVHGIEHLRLALGEVEDDHLDRAQHGEAAQRPLVQVLADGVLVHSHVGEAGVFGDADADGEVPQRLRRDAAPADAADRRQTRIIPAGDDLVLHERDELALGNDGMARDELGEFVLLRQCAGQIQALQNPVVERTMHLELQRADAVRDAFQIIAQAMREVVERIEAPLRAGVMMLHMTDAVEQGIAQPDVRGRHVDLRAKRARAVGELAILHPREEIEILLHGAIAERGILARFVGRAAIGVRVRGGKIADVGFALLDQRDGVFVNRPEVIRGVERLDALRFEIRNFRFQNRREQAIRLAVAGDDFRRLALGLEAQLVIRPSGDEPVHIRLDGLDILDLFLRRIRVIHAQVADAAELAGDAEVQADALGMADVQVAIRLRGKARVNLRIALLRDVLRDNVADEIAGGRRGGGGFVGAHVRHTATLTNAPGDVHARHPRRGSSQPQRHGDAEKAQGTITLFATCQLAVAARASLACSTLKRCDTIEAKGYSF